MALRYEIIGTCGGSCHEIEVAEDGEWVKFEDFESMRNALQTLVDAAGQWIESSEQLQLAYLNARAELVK